MNIVLFGDSLLGRFKKVLIDQLEGSLEAATVYNCAAGGWNTNDGARRVDYIARLTPDVVILSFGANDSAPWKEVVNITTFTSNMERMMDAFNPARTIALLCPQVTIEDPVQAKAFNAALGEYNEITKQLCERKGLDYIDCDELLKDLGPCHEEDGVHFNQLAYDAVIEEVCRILK